MLCKSALILLWAAASYVALVGWASTGWQALALATLLGLAMAGIGFAIQHDANHGAYPVSRSARRGFGFLLDLIGGSSYVWKFQHNVNHHTFTNIAGADNDINVGGFARLCAAQKRRPYHRLQHLYLWPLYSLLGINWFIWADWRDYITGAIGSNPFPRPRGGELALFWLGKTGWVTIAFVIPLMFHPPSIVLLFAVWTYLVLGMTMAIVFQLAHVVEEADFPVVTGDPARASTDFMRHQVATTIDFAPQNKLLNWYLGGLNYQIEHHLFPQICHLHYPAIAPIVEAVCRKHGVPYVSLPTFRAALASHVRWLYRMGRPATPEPALSSRGS